MEYAGTRDALASEALAPAELPRLTIQHLLVWTAVTAVALLPYRLLQEGFRPGGATNVNASFVAAMSVVSAIAAGTYLFVAAAWWHWKRQGLPARVEPGHWLAFQGILSWLVTSATYLLLGLSSRGIASVGFAIGLLSMASGLCVLVWFGALALRPGRPARWRCVFAAMAVAPVLTALLPILNFRFYSPAAGAGGFGFMMVAFGTYAAFQAALLSAALMGDWRGRASRHWSHWLASGARLVLLTSMVFYFVATWLQTPMT